MPKGVVLCSVVLSAVAHHATPLHHSQTHCVMQVVSSIHNLIIGKIYVDHGGVMRITSSATGMACKLKFKEQGMMRRHEAHEVRYKSTFIVLSIQTSDESKAP